MRKRTKSQDARKQLKEERAQIVLWKQPLTTLNYGLRELVITSAEWIQSLLSNKATLLLTLLASTILIGLYNFDGPHQQVKTLKFK